MKKVLNLISNQSEWIKWDIFMYPPDLQKLECLTILRVGQDKKQQELSHTSSGRVNCHNGFGD